MPHADLSTPDVAGTKDDGDFDIEVLYLLDFLGDICRAIRIYAKATGACKRLAA